VTKLALIICVRTEIVCIGRHTTTSFKKIQNCRLSKARHFSAHPVGPQTRWDAVTSHGRPTRCFTGALGASLILQRNLSNGNTWLLNHMQRHSSLRARNQLQTAAAVADLASMLRIYRVGHKKPSPLLFCLKCYCICLYGQNSTI